MKIRSTGLYNPFLVAMGATTIVMAPGDVYAGLERKVVDGLAWPWGSIAKYGWQRFLNIAWSRHSSAQASCFWSISTSGRD
jgi:TRAP-type C4-dicarboxylate transport system substrate-binding protein